ncbi:hypothetical protein [Nitritalea halalkaliphila]|uniref:hypothetical protein n=1 Tax=Nitritalea halalkaliphila TaxID=590849 RepID=UPI0005946BCC|nr:hypothetical protein [Nitritalea halalkaliphila]
MQNEKKAAPLQSQTGEAVERNGTWTGKEKADRSAYGWFSGVEIHEETSFKEFFYQQPRAKK